MAKIREFRQTLLTGGGFSTHSRECRVVEVENPDKDAIIVPPETPVHDWQPIENGGN